MPHPIDHRARTAALVALGWQGGPLRVGRHLARELIDRFGSPLYVFSAEVLRAQVHAVQAALGPRVTTLLSLKANPNAAVAAVAREEGVGAEVASAGELCVATLAGFAGPDIQFAGPGKSDLDLDRAIAGDVGVINVESETEYTRVVARSQPSRPQRVSIRVNPGTTSSGARLRMSDPSARFGVDYDQVHALARRILDERACTLVGLHTFAGSQNFDVQSFAESAARLAATAREVEQSIGAELGLLNFGGGFGWPTHEDDEVLDLAAMGRSLQQVIAAEDRGTRRYYVELGRYLTAPAGVYLCRVRDLKRSGGHVHAVLDGGLHHHAAAAGVAPGSRRRFAIVHADLPVPDQPQAVMLGGPLCTPNDRFGRHVPLAPLAIGDVVAVLNSGAYGLTYSAARFLGHPSPAEVMVDGDLARVVRDRGTPEDTIRDQRAFGDAGREESPPAL